MKKRVFDTFCLEKNIYICTQFVRDKKNIYSDTHNSAYILGISFSKKDNNRNK